MDDVLDDLAGGTVVEVVLELEGFEALVQFAGQALGVFGFERGAGDFVLDGAEDALAGGEAVRVGDGAGLREALDQEDGAADAGGDAVEGFCQSGEMDVGGRGSGVLGGDDAVAQRAGDLEAHVGDVATEGFAEVEVGVGLGGGHGRMGIFTGSGSQGV